MTKPKAGAKPDRPEDGQKTTYLLEMSSRADLRAPKRTTAEVAVMRVEIACSEYNWFLHQAVGVDYLWGGREDWGARDWALHVNRPELETWVAYAAGTPAGYYELEKEDDGSVRIECFGLCRQFIGKGLGGTLLATAVERCWEMGALRVWLTTCSHDHPHALRNYLARGFRLVRETIGPANPPRESLLFGPSES